MILVDTSVWIDHLRSGEPRLAALLKEFRVLTHPMVIGEPACGNLQNRREVLSSLDSLPAAPVADSEEARFFIERHRLAGRGIGFIDVHLLASASLAEPCRLWTHDRRLHRTAAGLGLAFG